MEDQNDKKPAAPAAIRMAVGWPIYILWALVCWYLLVFNQHTAIVILVGTQAFFALLQRFGPKTIRPFLMKLRTALTHTIGGVGLLAVFHPAYLLRPIYTAAFALLGAAIAFTPIPIKAKALATAGVFALAFGANLPAVPVNLAVFCAFFAAMFTAIALKKSLWMPTRSALFYLILVSALGISLYSFYKAPPPDTSQDVLAQPGVSAIFEANDPQSPLAQALGNQCRFIEQNCDGSLLLGGRGKQTGLVLYRDNKTILTRIKNVSDSIALDCEQNKIWAGEFEKRKILELNAQTGEALERYRFSKLAGVSRLRYDKKRNMLFASKDDAPFFLRIDLETKKTVTTKFDHVILDFDFSTELDALFISRWGGILKRLSLSKLEPQGSLFLPDWLIQFQIDDQKLLCYVTKFYGGSVVKVNLSTLEVIQTRKFEPGLRFPILDKKRNALFVANFFTGDCLMLDADTLEPITSRNFGPRLRSIRLSRDGSTLYAPSALGGFAWDLEALPPNLR
jgi:hypothetical protein